MLDGEYVLSANIRKQMQEFYKNDMDSLANTMLYNTTMERGRNANSQRTTFRKNQLATHMYIDDGGKLDDPELQMSDRMKNRMSNQNMSMLQPQDDATHDMWGGAKLRVEDEPSENAIAKLKDHQYVQSSLERDDQIAQSSRV